MAGTPALRPTAKRFSPILLQSNPEASYSSTLAGTLRWFGRNKPAFVKEITRSPVGLCCKFQC